MDNLVSIKKKAPKKALIKNKPGVFIKTYGCQMNVYDSEKLLRIVGDEYNPVDSPEEANLILINTCSVRDKPEQKLYSLLGELHPLKKDNEELLIGVGGCVAQQEGQTIIKRSKAVDFVFGTHNLSLVPSLIERRREGEPPQIAIDYRDEWEELPLGINGTGRVSQFVSISRGCNKNCAYCIVPTTRGKEVSRSAEEIFREIRIAVHRGAKEIVLLGQTVNSYGLDLNPRMKFTELMEEVSKIDGVERIRFTSPHPQEIRQDFIDLVAENPKICRSVHMPLQSGSDKILKAMNRNYRSKRYLDIIDSLKQRVPEISITTDIIVGFPGETEEDFEATLDVMRKVEFESSYSFMFSPRPGTPAEHMQDQLSKEVKYRRLQTLQTLQNEQTDRKLKAWVGKKDKILLDGPSATNPNTLQGRLSQNILVNLNEGNLSNLEPGMTVAVEITGSSKFTLKAKLIEA